jgi:hypothetical protein
MAVLRDTIRDVELVCACLNGDHVAWAALIRGYQRLIYSVARVLCPDRDDADEVFQQVCRRLLTGLYFCEEPVSYRKIVELIQMPLASIGPTRARWVKKRRAILSAA